jgi:creatinine amidohydrolase
MMEITPDLVLPLSEAGTGKAKKFSIDGLRNGVAWAPRTWTKVTDDTGSGDPSRATRAKGARHLEAVTDAIADFLVQLAGAESPDSYA